MLESAERAGLADMRAEVVGGARGRTLEIGGGTGHNLPHYTSAVSRLTLTEPDPHMAKRLRAKVDTEPATVPAEVIDAPAEKLPFADSSFDTVVSTLVLCTVTDVERSVAEIGRVLAKDGRLLMLEHVRDPAEGSLARWQDRLERPWGWVAGGCHPNRDTVAGLRAAGFAVELELGEFPKAGPLIKPIVRGSATIS